MRDHYRCWIYFFNFFKGDRLIPFFKLVDGGRETTLVEKGKVCFAVFGNDNFKNIVLSLLDAG